MLHTISSLPGRYTITPERFNRLILSSRHKTVTIDDGFAECFPALSVLGPEQAARVIVFLVTRKAGAANDWDHSGELAGKPLLTWDQIAELHKLGIRFGSHSATHPDLRDLTRNDLEREVKGSKQELEERLNVPIRDFCYPYGQFNAGVIRCVEQAGYTTAYTTSDSLWQGTGNPYRTRRIEIKGTDSEWLVSAKLTGLYDVKAVWELPALVWEKVTGKRKKISPQSRGERREDDR